MEIDESQIKTMLLQEKAEEKRLEMIWFGGIIRNSLYQDVYRVTLELS